MTERRLKHSGWGYEDQAPNAEQLAEAAAGIRGRCGVGGGIRAAVPVEGAGVRPPRLKRPDAFGDLFTDAKYERVSRALGKAYRDIVRGFRGEFENPPDPVALPRHCSELETVLNWAEAEGAAVVPFGGGTSVVGGVEARLADRPVVTMDLRRLDRLVEVDPVSLAARIEAGATGPRLEEQLREHGLTMRCFPQTFEYATLGGWIATRAGGHFATKETHVDDLVESVRAVTPRGTWESRRLPGSGAGPSPDRLLLGSEGILGVVTDAWVRGRPRPDWKAAATVRFERFGDACASVREIVQAGLDPANCRLLEAAEAELTGAGDGKSHLLLLSFESAHHPVEAPLRLAIEAAESHDGVADAPRVTAPVPDPGEGSALTGRKLKEGLRNRPTNTEEGGAAESWRGAFLLAPYLRDTFVACGVLSETFETAITWDRLGGVHGTPVGTTPRGRRGGSGAPAAGRGGPP